MADKYYLKVGNKFVRADKTLSSVKLEAIQFVRKKDAESFSATIGNCELWVLQLRIEDKLVSSSTEELYAVCHVAKGYGEYSVNICRYVDEFRNNKFNLIRAKEVLIDRQKEFPTGIFFILDKNNNFYIEPKYFISNIKTKKVFVGINKVGKATFSSTEPIYYNSYEDALSTRNVLSNNEDLTINSL